MPVFVQADEPAIQKALVDALVGHGDIAAVDHAGGAAWIVLTTSLFNGGDRPAAERLVALVTSMEAPRPCDVVGPSLAALAASRRAGPEWPAISPAAVTRLGAALVRTAGRPSELTPREEAVLSLVAQGLTTAEVAAELSYSERSIKNVIKGVTDRLALRNRCHVVAHAVRKGWI